MMTARRLWWRHLVSVLLLPSVMTIAIPLLIVGLAGLDPLPMGPARWVAGAAGVLFAAGGVGMLVWTVVLFDRVGKGTLGISEPVNLVVRGPYRHVRNPMMSGVFGILLGEVLLTTSPWLLCWFLLFLTVVAIAIRVVEEPHLVKRYGSQYEDYRRHVPRWVPARTPWEPARQDR